jgi:hypothetical protein
MLMRPRHYHDVPDFDRNKITGLWAVGFPSPEDDLRYAVSIVASMADDIDGQIGPGRGDLLLCTLRGYQPMRYAMAVMTAYAQAKHEQSVWAQLQKMKISLDAARHVVADCREKREPVNHGHTLPLAFEPIVSSTTLTGKIHVLLDGVRFAQWDLEDAKGHATHVLEVAAMCPCDQAYYEAISGTGMQDKGVPTPDEEHQRVARAAVSMLGEHFDTPATVDGWEPDKNQ